MSMGPPSPNSICLDEKVDLLAQEATETWSFLLLPSSFGKAHPKYLNGLFSFDI